MAETLTFPPRQAAKLEPYLPPATQHPETETTENTKRPFVTLTFATSLDSALSLAPGVRTALSGPASKAMTHFLRSRHDAICVGVGTAVADDPGLNCRLALDPTSSVQQGEGEGERKQHQPRPIVIDPRARWEVGEESKVIQMVREGMGLAPFIITGVELAGVPASQKAVLEKYGGKYIHRPTNSHGSFVWQDILAAVENERLNSIMVEGGGHIINSLLEGPNRHFVDSVIVTIAPVWLGQGGVVVSPRRVESETPAARLAGASWHQLGEDVVLCGKLER